MRIAVVGNSGSGKSTFAKWLAYRLALPLLHVDKWLWLPGWEPRPEQEMNAALESFMRKPSWVIDGIGTRLQLEERLSMATFVILMDTPLEVCRVNALLRAHEQEQAPNEFIAPELRYNDVLDRQLEVIESFERNWMPWLREKAATDGWVRYEHYSQAYEDKRWERSSDA
jgi:adenylate kinase family enzyme